VTTFVFGNPTPFVLQAKENIPLHNLSIKGMQEFIDMENGGGIYSNI
jgi:hypothetical protein